MVATIAAVLFPARCPGCGVAAEPMCSACRTTVLPAPNAPTPTGLDSLHVPFAYDGVVRELVARAKYRNRHAALAWCATEMAVGLRNANVGVDVITWAPTTASRRRHRGFDQAELLASLLGDELRLPVRRRLRRTSHRAQTGADRAARVSGPRFVAVGREIRTRERIVLVDDVVTTGATMAAAAVALRNGGANVVHGVAAARRP